MRTAAVLVLGLIATACGGSANRVIVAAGTTLVDSGFIDELAEAYETANPGTQLSIVGLSTREVLDFGAHGAADVLITHAPDQEDVFLGGHSGALAVPVFASRFLLVGPPQRAAELDGLTSVEAMREIAGRSWEFVSRADGSGTFDAETELWDRAGVVPRGAAWYSETGQGMGLSLQVADQLGGFIVVEKGTFLVGRDVLRLRPVGLDGYPANPYTAIVLSSEAAAKDFVAWLVSDAGREVVLAVNGRLFGEVVFEPFSRR